MSDIYDRLTEVLGWSGRILSFTKQRPGVMYNANVFAGDGRKLWYGDVQLNADLRVQLQSIADDFDVSIYVTPEHPWRFIPEEKIAATFQNYAENSNVVKFEPKQPQER